MSGMNFRDANPTFETTWNEVTVKVLKSKEYCNHPKWASLYRSQIEISFKRIHQKIVLATSMLVTDVGDRILFE